MESELVFAPCLWSQLYQRNSLIAAQRFVQSGGRLQDAPRTHQGVCDGTLGTCSQRRTLFDQSYVLTLHCGTCKAQYAPKLGGVQHWNAAQRLD